MNITQHIIYNIGIISEVSVVKLLLSQNTAPTVIRLICPLHGGDQRGFIHCLMAGISSWEWLCHFHFNIPCFCFFIIFFLVVFVVIFHKFVSTLHSPARSCSWISKEMNYYKKGSGVINIIFNLEYIAYNWVAWCIMTQWIFFPGYLKTRHIIEAAFPAVEVNPKTNVSLRPLKTQTKYL